MLDEGRLRKLKSFRDELDSQDKILVDASKGNPNYGLAVPQARAIIGIFESIRSEFPECILPKFDWHSAPSVMRTHISIVRSAVQRMFDDHEREAEQEAKRYELRLSLDAARRLLKEWIDEGSVLTNDPGYALKYPDVVDRWVNRTFGTLNRVFSSQLNAQEFASRARLDARSGVDYLRSIDEELYVRRHAPTKAETKTMGTKIFIGHGRSPAWRELKDFLQDDLHQQVEEFNREPPAGMFTGERLNEMLENAASRTISIPAALRRERAS